MSITKQQAWTIFQAVSLGQEEGAKAVDSLIGTEQETYEGFAEEFAMEVAKVSVAAQNEAATIQAEHTVQIEQLQATPMNRWKALDYIAAVHMFKGSKFETLHLSAMFRMTNNELLLELAKPQL